MPKKSNDDLVRRIRELRITRVKNASRQAAEQIVKIGTSKKPPTVEQIALITEQDFLRLPG